jgi:hypothetical protein
MTQIPIDGNDSLLGVQAGVVQSGTQLGKSKNPGNTSRGSEPVIYGDQIGISNFANRSVVERVTENSCHTEA